MTPPSSLPPSMDMTTKTSEHTGRTIKRKNSDDTWVLGNVLGAGTEGEVYEITNDHNHAVKIYRQGRRPNRTHTAKLTAMEGKLTEQPLPPGGRPKLAWPTQLIRDTKDNSLVGFVMPRIRTTEAIPIGQYWNPSLRPSALRKLAIREHDPSNTSWSAVSNLARTVELVHDSNCLIGDVNERNILIYPATGDITIVDCDSFQIHDPNKHITYRCNVGRPEYTAPELLRILDRPCTDKLCPSTRDPHKKRYGCINRTKQHDLFSLAIVVFKLLMDGSHPYDCLIHPSSPTQAQTIRDRIVHGLYPFGPTPPHGIQPRAASERKFQSLPQQAQLLFHRAFRAG